ncbi:MAG: lysine--tRNA ligase, partial [Simkaniaceae bacterium]|nr:lysine--tRNA ligase [Simkaniaceae bacterium]
MTKLKEIQAPEYHAYEEFQNRSEKLKEIRALGVEPYPHKYLPTHDMRSLNEKFEGSAIGGSEEAGNGSTDLVLVAGRLVLFRAMGKNAFGHLQDETGRIQIMFNRDS